MSSSPQIACRLTAPEQADHLDELRNGLFTNAVDVQARENGYTFTFAGTDANASTLLAFVGFERQCCPFLTFGLTISPEPGPIALSLTGASPVNTFIRDSFVALMPAGPAAPTVPTGSSS